MKRIRIFAILMAMFLVNNSSWGQIMDNGEHRFSPNSQTIQVANSLSPSIGIIGDNSGTTAAWAGPSSWGVSYTETFAPGPAGNYSRPFNGNTITYRIWRVPVGVTVSVTGGSAVISGIDAWFVSPGANRLYDSNGVQIGANNQTSYTVSGTGTQTFTLRTTDGSGLTGTYDLHIPVTFQTTLSSDANLSSLSVPGYTLTPGFNASTTSYSVSVANNVSSVTINATANHGAATVSGTGTKSLSVGSNPFDVVVTAEDGTIKTYTVTITRATVTYYTITFDADGGDPTPEPQNVEAGGLVAEPAEPAKEGFSFEGWYHGEVEWNFPSDVVTGNITLVARWENLTAIEALSSSPVRIYSQNGNLIIKSEASNIEKVEVYDISGRILKIFKGINNYVEISGLPKSQMLIVKAVAENGEVIRCKVHGTR